MGWGVFAGWKEEGHENVKRQVRGCGGGDPEVRVLVLGVIWFVVEVVGWAARV